MFPVFRTIEKNTTLLKKHIGKWLSILLPVLLGIFLIVYTYEKFTSEQILEIKGYFKNADYSYIYTGLFVAFLGNASRAYRWKFALEHMGYSTSFYNNFMAFRKTHSSHDCLNLVCFLT